MSGNPNGKIVHERYRAGLWVVMGVYGLLIIGMGDLVFSTMTYQKPVIELECP